MTTIFGGRKQSFRTLGSLNCQRQGFCFNFSLALKTKSCSFLPSCRPWSCVTKNLCTAKSVIVQPSCRAHNQFMESHKSWLRTALNSIENSSLRLCCALDLSYNQTITAFYKTNSLYNTEYTIYPASGPIVARPRNIHHNIDPLKLEFNDSWLNKN